MWTKGKITVEGVTFEYWMKHFEEPSCFGINEGRISKLELREGGKVVLNYDRGWDIRPRTKKAKAALEQLLKEFN